MKTKKTNTVAIIITLILAIFVFLVGFTNKKFEQLPLKYQIYLDGKSIGVINDSNELYALINKEQSAIKDQYNVDQVYPPKGFEIEKYISYDEKVNSVDEIYDQIKNSKDFTIKGYTITISTPPTDNEDAKVSARINVLDKSVFEESINRLINSFIAKDKYDAYMSDSQTPIKETGSLIENIYFNENISIKEAYLSIEDKIFTDSESLTRYLMFSDENASEDYTVQKGDTIASIANAHERNTNEFLIANPKFKNENNMLAVGEVVNVALIKPLITIVVDEYIVEDTEVKYDTEIKYDSSKSSSYKKVEVEGKNGIQRVAKHVQVTNGAVSEGGVIDKDNTYMIREVVNEVITRGNKSYNPGSGEFGNFGTYVDDGTNWAWPTNYPYILSSPYGWRWGTIHNGQDITGTGYGSPIYSVGNGVVRFAGYGGYVGGRAGLNIVIEHPNGYWSVYAHLSDVYVTEGQTVTRKQKIGAMGHSGVATGTHLHFSIVDGVPYDGGKFFDPMQLWKK